MTKRRQKSRRPSHRRTRCRQSRQFKHTHTDTNGDGEVDDLSGGVDNPDTGKRPERDGKIKDPSTSISDVDKTDNLDICISDADGDGGANNPSKGIDDSGINR